MTKTLSTILATSCIYLAITVYMLATHQMEIQMGGFDEQYVISQLQEKR